jgi:predicted small lipoprotein YifL
MRKGVGLLLVAMCVATLAGCGGPGPTPTPAYARYQADDVWHAVQAAGLPVSGWRDNATVGASLVPHTWREAREFTIGDGSAGGGQVFTFATPGDQAAVQAWFARAPDLSPYVYSKGNALLWISGFLPRADAASYEAALVAMK